MDFDIYNFEVDYKGLLDINDKKNANKLKKFNDLNLNLSKVIQSTYGAIHKEKSNIDFFLRNLFKGYIFDDGIHPEFIGPHYIRKV